MQKNPTNSTQTPEKSGKADKWGGLPGLFKTPFSPSYWKAAAGELKSIRIIVLTALFIAIRIAISSLFVPVGENLRIYFSFFVNALGSMILGPVIALISGFLTDILGFVIHPTGAFFPGYVLTSMLGSFFYAIFLYRTRISIVRIFCSKLCVNVLVNIGLGSVWSAMLYSKGFYYYLIQSFTKNIILLPIETILLVLFLQLMLPILTRVKAVPQQPTLRIPWF